MSTTDSTHSRPIAARRVDVDATITRLPDTSYKTLHEALGGFIEAVPADGSYTIWINEEGKLLELAPNVLGEGLWYLIDSYGCFATGDWMAGPCVVTGPIDANGDPEPVGDDLAFTICLLAAAVRKARARQAAASDLDGDRWTP